MATETITFVVPGQAVSVDASTPPAGLTHGRVKHSVRVGARRAGGGDVRVVAVPGEDVVVLHIANGPSLTLHPDNARDLFLAQGESSPSRGAAAPGEVWVPIELRWRGLEGRVPTRGSSQGFLGDVLLAGVDVVTDLVTDAAADFAASAVVKAVDAQVVEGVYALQPDILPKLKGSEPPLRELPAANDGGPLLVLVHGTFSETHGTFGKLWTDHPQHVRTLFTKYARRVYALDHQTLGASPIANAITLAKALPRGARLHLVTHSRGGLVAEVLARLCATPDADVVASELEDLADLADLVKQKRFTIERVVRVA